MKSIAPGLYQVPGMIVGRVYLIEDADGLTLVDSSIAPSGAKILQRLEAWGRGARDVRRILITHAHPDHVGGLPLLKEKTGAQLIASALEKPVIEGKQPVARVPAEALSGPSRLLRPPKTTFSPVPVDRVVSDGELLAEVMGGLHVVASPGHAPGHLAFWQPERRILFCGDTLFNTFGLSEPYRFLTVDHEENRRSIAKLVALEPEIVCFGHGEPLHENSAARLRQFAAKQGIG